MNLVLRYNQQLSFKGSEVVFRSSNIVTIILGILSIVDNKIVQN